MLFKSWNMTGWQLKLKGCLHEKQASQQVQEAEISAETLHAQLLDCHTRCEQANFATVDPLLHRPALQPPAPER